MGIGTESPDAKLVIKSEGDGNQLLKLDTERAWFFEQKGAGAAAELLLRPEDADKKFTIGDVNGGVLAQFNAKTTDSSKTITLVPNDGSVGIGTSAPGNMFQVGGTISSNRFFQVDNSGRMTARFGDNSMPTILSLQNNSITTVGNGVAVDFQLANGGAAPINAARITAITENTTYSGSTADASLTFSTTLNASLSERIRITSAGDVGIGETAPDSLLHIKGSAVDLFKIERSASSTNVPIEYRSSNGVMYAGLSEDNDFVIATGADLNSNDVMSFGSDGDVAIGAAPTSNRRLRITDTSGSDTWVSIRTNNTTGRAGLLFGDTSSDTVGRVEYANNGDTMKIYTGSSVRGTFSSTGLDVAGLVQCNSFRIDQSPTSETITATHTITISANGTDYKIPCVAA